jgi:hypothetical protein
MEGLIARGNSPGLPFPVQWRCERSSTVRKGDEWELDSSAMLCKCIKGEVPLVVASIIQCRSVE